MASDLDFVQTLVAAKALIIGLWLLIWFVWERLAPSAILERGLRKVQIRRWGRNLGLFVLNAAASPLVTIPLTALAATHALEWRPDWWSGVLGLAIDLLIFDAYIYAWHRANHAVPFLWRFHQVHHLDMHLDVTSAVRFHLGEVVISAAARGAFIVLIGAPLASVLVFEIFLLCASIFHHSNAKLPAPFESFLSKLIVTPSLHWLHHHAVREDTDSTYGLFFSFWDRLFQTQSRTVRTVDMPIGLENDRERPFFELLLTPFRK